jgi:hypothetical protein
MLFTRGNVSIIEFAMKPHCNRCFGYMAMAFGFDYWLVPQISCYYHQKYRLDQYGVGAAIKVLRHVINMRGLSNLLRVPDEAHFDDNDEL